MNSLDQIEQLAVSKVDGSASLEEVEKVAAIVKSIADSRKSNVDIAVKKQETRLEAMKSLSTLLVPLVSILTLLGTIIIQAIQLNAQLESARRQSEDAEWRDLLASVKTQAKDYASDVTISSRIRTFINSERYRDQAKYLAIRMMGKLTNSGSFKELFYSVISESNPADARSIAEVLRSLFETRNALEFDCRAQSADVEGFKDFYFGVCAFAIPESDIITKVKAHKNAKELLDLRRGYTAVSDQLAFSSQALAAFLRRYSSIHDRSRPLAGLDLSNVLIMNADFSEIDLSPYDLTYAIFDGVKLKDAIVTPRKYEGFQLHATAWWNASQIEKRILQGLIAERFPFYEPLVLYPDGDVTRADYEARVKQLCGQERFCEPPLPFNAPGPVPIRSEGAPRAQ